MEITYIDEKNLKTLEDYCVFLVTGMLSLKTLQNMHVKAIEIGILPEDMACRSNTMIWDIRRLIKLYQEQLETILELLPSDFNAEEIIKAMQKRELTKARQIIRKPQTKEPVK